jgi:outer membrane receptor protein involved in Fe transport
MPDPKTGLTRAFSPTRPVRVRLWACVSTVLCCLMLACLLAGTASAQTLRGTILDFDSLKDFLAVRLSGGRQARGNSRRDTFQNSHAAYVQDSFRVRRNVTLNAGLRYDYLGVIGERNNLLSNFDSRAGLVLVGTGGLNSLYEPDRNDFSPRLGLAWDVTGRGQTVERVPSKSSQRYKA